MPVTHSQGGPEWYLGHEEGPTTRYGDPTTQQDNLDKRSYFTVTATSRSYERFLAGNMSEEDFIEGVRLNAEKLEVDPFILKVEATIRFASKKFIEGKLTEDEISTIAQDLGYSVEQLYDFINMDVITQKLYADAYNLK